MGRCKRCQGRGTLVGFKPELDVITELTALNLSWGSWQELSATIRALAATASISCRKQGEPQKVECEPG
jgi:hypothetical protein